MIALISPESTAESELGLLHVFFESGLQYFHLRKPNYRKHDLVQYLDLVLPSFRDRIVVHHDHDLAYQYGLRGIHIQEKHRIDMGNDISSYVERFRRDGFTVSASFHDPDELMNYEDLFDYCLLSPVFDSISKKNYFGKGFDVNHVDRLILGMGGVTEANVADLIPLGYRGAALLGGVWQSDHPNQVVQTMLAFSHTHFTRDE